MGVSSGDAVSSKDEVERNRASVCDDGVGRGRKNRSKVDVMENSDGVMGGKEVDRVGEEEG